MNLILFESDDPRPHLPADDRRARHIRDVLRKSVGDTLHVGVIGGSRGTATIVTADADGSFGLEINWTRDPRPPIEPPFVPVTLLIGLPRPQTARKILRECTTLGVAALWFVRGELGERSYATSKLWSTDEWQRLIVEGAEQACSTWLPEVLHFPWLGKALDQLADDGSESGDNAQLDRVALHPAEVDGSQTSSPPPLVGRAPTGARTILAIGPERGWTAKELTALNHAGFARAHLGPRILRTETACTASLTLLAAAHGALGRP